MQAIEDHDSSKVNVNVPITVQTKSLKEIPEVISESPNKQGERKLYKSADAKQNRFTSENSEKEEEGKERPLRDRRYSINILKN